ncbi:hypothetical protein KVR01_010507 [Diaporthe batatas]|uniref:uncharacterized protein n=1 Tax=Diaporthe batatas TaxID=748121 RepID=UPI001D05212C|nr:uncharacterized protein KVR01_010507 [Diaporthe batatas]KAG8159870.1 hypothetical protein KVR01_010507 [Diaporthe batatas]
MSRGRGRGGRFKSQNVTNHGGDIEMKDSNFRPKHEPDRRNRVGKNSPPPPTGGTRGGRPRGGANTPVSRRTRAKGNNNNNNVNNKRLSIISMASTAQAEPWCDKCSRLNRQLHSYLLEILKTGEDAIGDWAYAVGASPDHMECEPAPERIIPEGYRRCSRQHHPWTEGEARTATSILPGCTSNLLPFGAYAGQFEGTASQSSAGSSPFSLLGPGPDFPQRMNARLPALSGTNLQSLHTLAAIPENMGVQEPRHGAPSQVPLPAPQPIQPPWNGGFGRPVAMYPN